MENTYLSSFNYGELNLKTFLEIQSYFTHHYFFHDDSNPYKTMDYFRNVPVINIASEIDVAWSATLRTGAFVILLLRAGLGLKLDILRKNKVDFNKTSQLQFISSLSYNIILLMIINYSQR